MATADYDYIVKIPKLHPGQMDILKASLRFNKIQTGRRWGKTTMIKELSTIAIDEYFDNEEKRWKGKKVGIWFPTYKDLDNVWESIKNTYHDVIKKRSEQLKSITLLHDGVIDFWSMEDPDSGRGRSYHRAIIDEAAKAKKFRQAWEYTIRPTLTDFAGDAFFFSTPQGKYNFFYEIEEIHSDDPEWAFFRFTSYDNPFLDPSEIDLARNSMDDFSFRQEYLAEDVNLNDKPYLYTWDESNHIIESYEPSHTNDIIISFDFNVDPMTCIIGQMPDYKTARVFNEIKLPDGGTEELCEMIKAKYQRWLGRMKITGDATGNNRNTAANRTNYQIIQQVLDVPDYNLILPKKNLLHKVSRPLCNSVQQNADIKITRNCTKTIADINKAAVDSSGELIKTSMQGMHFFDNYRYFIHACFPDYTTKPHLYE